MHTDSRTNNVTKLKMIRDPKTGKYTKRSHEVKTLVSKRTDRGFDWTEHFTHQWLKRRLVVGDVIAFTLGFLVAILIESLIK